MKPNSWLAGIGVPLLGAWLAVTLPAEARADNLEIFMDSTVAIDTVERTITLPFFRGSHDGEEVFYVVLESSDRDDAESRGVNWAPKLANALGTEAVQAVSAGAAGEVQFAGSVDFAPERQVAAGPAGFPPALAVPGSTGDAAYSPLISSGDGVVLNAPQIANASGRHDKVIAIDEARQLAVLALTPGFYHDNLVLYISTDASDPVAAALEGATFAPLLNAAPGLARNDVETSARSGLVLVINGERGDGNPERQGISSALLDGLPPLNILEIHPRNRGRLSSYSPLWDVHPAVWTEEAVLGDQRRRLEHHRDVAEAVEDGLLVSGGFGLANPEFGGLRAAGFIVNCPVMSMSSDTDDER